MASLSFVTLMLLDFGKGSQ